jgi:cysteine desulfurase
MKLPVYMDHHATTPVDPRVVERMVPFFSEEFGNAASRSHAYGWKAESAMEAAREAVAALLGGTPRETIFVSGATEANNLALFGVAAAYESKGRHIITQATEHKAVLDPLEALRKRGYEITVVPVSATGRVNPADVADAIRNDTILVSIMLANNEVGTIQPLAEIGGICRERGVLFHTDAVQGFGRIPFHAGEMSVDLASVSAHKLHGPKGAGALFLRRKSPRVRLAPMFHGGGHERGLRPGTPNVPAIVGFGEACRIAAAEREIEAKRVGEMRDRLQERLEAELDVRVHGDRVHRLPNNLNLSFLGLEGDALMMGMREVAVSSGSACTSTTLEPSHVLRALGCPDEVTRAAVRFGLGRGNTEDEVEFVATTVIEAARKAAALRRR